MKPDSFTTEATAKKYQEESWPGFKKPIRAGGEKDLVIPED